MLPRAVIIERPTQYRELVERHGTREQARFFLRQRGLELDPLETAHGRQEAARAVVTQAIPHEWTVASVQRDDLDRFLFTADDVVIVLGQDGLVANVAKYLDGQPVIGLNPEPDEYPGVLVPHAPEATGDLCADLAAGRAALERRTMVQARLDDGQRMFALNELFLGHHNHQSARYSLEFAGRSERQSSSGMIIATGTGATGWASSINAQRADPLPLPGCCDATLAWFVREPWLSPTTRASLTGGLASEMVGLDVTCELGSGGVLFGDGIEDDRIALDWGQHVEIGIADRTLALAR